MQYLTSYLLFLKNSYFRILNVSTNYINVYLLIEKFFLVINDLKYLKKC